MWIDEQKGYVTIERKTEAGFMKLGILGPGRIARTVAPTLVALPEIECYPAGDMMADNYRSEIWIPIKTL